MQDSRDAASGLTVLELTPAGASRLAFVLHGRGANKEDLLDLGQILAADGWAVVLPDAPISWGGGYAWYAELDPGSRPPARARARHAARPLSRRGSRNVARKPPSLRISQGGVTSLDVALHQPALVARVACLSGYLSLEDAPAGPIAPLVRVFMGHGSEDEMIPLERARASREALEAREVAVAWHEYAMPHSIVGAEVEDLRSWIRG